MVFMILMIKKIERDLINQTTRMDIVGKQISSLWLGYLASSILHFTFVLSTVNGGQVSRLIGWAEPFNRLGSYKRLLIWKLGDWEVSPKLQVDISQTCYSLSSLCFLLPHSSLDTR